MPHFLSNCRCISMSVSRDDTRGHNLECSILLPDKRDCDVWLRWWVRTQRGEDAPLPWRRPMVIYYPNLSCDEKGIDVTNHFRNISSSRNLNFFPDKTKQRCFQFLTFGLQVINRKKHMKTNLDQKLLLEDAFVYSRENTAFAVWKKDT